MHGLAEVLRAPRAILCLGAHCDDIEIGCGGTLRALRRQNPAAEIHWVIFSGDDVRKTESLAAASRLIGSGPKSQIEVLGYRGSYFPSQFDQIKDYFETLKNRVKPDLIFTHHLGDRHQDHRAIGELTWNSFRDHLILEYEIAKYEGDLGAPNFFCPLTSEDAAAKVDTLMSCFPSQHARRWFEPELFRSVMRLRGMECNAPSGHAEAFHARKIVMELNSK